MKTALSVLMIIVMAFTLVGCDKELINRDVLYQSSNISALMAGVYDGDMTLDKLARNGDFGIGTFNGLDGEMLLHRGAFYRIASNGTAYPFADEVLMARTKVPFAAVTFFDTDQSIAINGIVDYAQLQRHIDNFLQTKNVPVAIRIEGLFRRVRVRSVPRQSEPYRPLAEITERQPEYEFQDVRGLLVGFRLPEFMAGVNVPGYHLHFITADRTQGGHVLELQMENVNVQLDYTHGFEMVLPNNELYTQSNFATATADDIDRVE